MVNLITTTTPPPTTLLASFKAIFGQIFQDMQANLNGGDKNQIYYSCTQDTKRKNVASHSNLDGVVSFGMVQNWVHLFYTPEKPLLMHERKMSSEREGILKRRKTSKIQHACEALKEGALLCA